jgi:thymidylate synthase
MDLSYAIANVLWTLSGSSNAGDIAPYNPRGLAFTADGINLACAVGARLFRSSAGDQIDNAVRLLREHPGTRRAIAVVGDPSDTQLTPRDFPCQLGIQFLLRDRHLHCVVAMRSQSAALVLPYDVFLHTMLQELVAREIGAELGDYHHVCFSAHYYTDEAALVERILGAPRGVDPAPMPPMPRSDRELLCRVESQMRGSEDPVNTLYRAGLDPYWAELLLLVARRLASSAA